MAKASSGTPTRWRTTGSRSTGRASSTATRSTSSRSPRATTSRPMLASLPGGNCSVPTLGLPPQGPHHRPLPRPRRGHRGRRRLLHGARTRARSRRRHRAHPVQPHRPARRDRGRYRQGHARRLNCAPDRPLWARRAAAPRGPERAPQNIRQMLDWFGSGRRARRRSCCVGG